MKYLTPESIAAVTGWLSAVGAAVYAAVKRLRQNATLAAKEIEDQIQQRINAAVESERERQNLFQAVEEDRIQRLKEIAEEWKDIATQRRAKIELLEEQLNKLSGELADLRTKYEEVLRLFADSQAQLSEIRREMEKLNRQ